jgi:branched-subunit amino acid ABC-type transport system permease component
MPDIYTYSKRVAIAAFVTLLVLAGFYLLGWHLYFFLLVFSAILLAVLFCGMTDWFVDKLHLKRGLGLLMAAPLLAVLLVLVNELYVKDVLEKSPDELPEKGRTPAIVEQ